MTLDLTERGTAEDELRRSEERLRLLVEAVVDYAIYLLDPGGRVTTWNTGAEKIKGYVASDVIGRNFSMFFPGEDVRAGKPQEELALARRHGRFEEEGFRVRKDGSRFWASVVLTPIYDEERNFVGFAKVTRDLSARLAAEQTAQELSSERAARAAAEAAAIRVRDSESHFRTLNVRLQAILAGVGDGIIVQSAAGEIIFANDAAAVLCGFDSAQELLSAAPQEINARFDLFDEAGRPFPLDQLPGRRVLRGEPAGSVLMRVRQRASGKAWWAVVRASGVAGDEGTPELAVTVWHDVTQERQREQNDKYLAQATAALAESLDYSATLSTLATLLVPGLADWCTIHLLSHGRLEPVATAHVDPEKVRFAQGVQRRYPADPDQPRGVWNVIRTGSSELYPSISDELLTLAARGPEHLALLREAGMASVLIVPIRMRARVLGTLSLVFAESGRHYDAGDLRLAEELGQRAGTSIENARLYAAEKRAREHVVLLARAGEAFSGANSYEEMLASVVNIALPTLADFAFFDLLEGGDQVRRIARAHEDPAIDALVNSTQWVRSDRRDRNLSALSSGAPALYPAIDETWLQDVATGPEQLAVLRRLQLRSLIAVPLWAREQLLGSLTLCFGTSGRQHTEEDLQLAEELARRAAIAVTQARLYAAAERARETAEHAARAAEEANRVKDEFLATVSHELRTPLQAILGWSAVLKDTVSDPSAERGLAAIHRNAVAQGKIVEDILDVSRIITGNLRIELQQTDLSAIVRDSIEAIRPSTVMKTVSVHYSAPNEPVTVTGDSGRLQQVVWNLLSNSLKFSEQGGHVEISLRRAAAGVTMTVSDTGRGIDSAFLPFVFDRFKQADSSSTRHVGGLGLGLAIVRYLVELHGGRVEARSAGLGQGATFEVTLPLMPEHTSPADA